jgi:hypothetical protein
MAFVSVGAEINLYLETVYILFGLYSLCIQDEIYHLVSLLYSNEDSKPECGQPYVFDSAEATTKRL